MAVSMVSPDGRYDDLYLSNFALLQVSDYLARIRGRRRILWRPRLFHEDLVEPGKISALGMTADDVVEALREQMLQIAAGNVGGQPALPVWTIR
jgi:multidrug efflux pump subunit AcrB